MSRPTNLARLEMPAAEIETALLWLCGELDLAGVAQMRGKFNASNSLAWVAPRLREAWRRGLIRIRADEGTFTPIERLVDKPPKGVV